MAFTIGCIWLLVSSLIAASVGEKVSVWSIIWSVFFFMVVLGIILRFISINFTARANDLDSELDFWATKKVNND